ncbi:hypothetical protein FQA39_LY05073 [Lamprigera yunnana]|nr:hypothetical protein FQA39_LY05073 [Lamprigera yunnana]
MSRQNVRRAASKEALKQMQLLSETAYDDDPSDTFEIPPGNDIINDEMPPKKKYRLSHRKSSDGNDRDVIVLKSVDMDDEFTDELFKLDVWPEEELQPIQSELHNKVHAELQEITKRIESLTKQNNAEVVYQGEACSIYTLEMNVMSSSSPNTLPDVTKRKMVTSTKATSQNVAIKPKNNSYQLVMDPRIGLIVGTMTPAATAAGTVAATTITSPLTGKSQSPVPAVQTRTTPTRRRGRNSIPLPSTPKPQKLISNMLSTSCGKHLHAQAHDIAYNVYIWIKSENEDQFIKEIKEKMSRATGESVIKLTDKENITRAMRNDYFILSLESYEVYAGNDLNCVRIFWKCGFVKISPGSAQPIHIGKVVDMYRQK